MRRYEDIILTMTGPIFLKTDIDMSKFWILLPWASGVLSVQTGQTVIKE